MIVHAIEETLDKGLKKDGQVVVSILDCGRTSAERFFPAI